MAKLTTRLRSTFANAYDLIRKGQLRTLIPFLTLLKLNGATMSLKWHFQFAPMYNTVQAPNTVWMCGRQLGKSYALCSSSGLRSALVPSYHQLIVQPRADQIQRLNSTVYQPLLRSCPIQDEFISNMELSKLALKTFNNGSLVYLEHMLVSADRVRGVSGAASCYFDECQDIEYEHLTIAKETMSASVFWGFSCYTGTPKTTDTTLALLWDRSSKAEWVIRCHHCGFFNIPNPEHHLLKMIGKHGVICAKCGRPIDPRNGGYVAAIPDRMMSFPGYHISQTIHPIHMLNDTKWGRILDKIENYRELELYNEVFGWPFDAATSPLTLSDMQKATFVPTDQYGTKTILTKPSDFEKIADQYAYVTVGVDWSGGGMISDSYTSYAVLGLRAGSDIIDVLYGKRIPKGTTPTEEANEILSWISGTGADAFAYDNGGAGFARLEIMNHQGLRDIPNLVIVPVNYVRPRSGDVMQPHTGQRESDLYYYTLDKSRSLAITIMAIKSCRIRFMPFDAEDEKAYQRDFMALREDPRKSLGNETVILIIKKPGVPDDFAHAVNFGCSQIWDHFGAYPRIGSKYDASILDLDENNQQILPDEVFGPRGDFERFKDAVEGRSIVIGPDNDWY